MPSLPNPPFPFFPVPYLFRRLLRRLQSKHLMFLPSSANYTLIVCFFEITPWLSHELEETCHTFLSSSLCLLFGCFSYWLLVALSVQDELSQQVKPEGESSELWLKMFFISVPFWKHGTRLKYSQTADQVNLKFTISRERRLHFWQKYTWFESP